MLLVSWEDYLKFIQIVFSNLFLTVLWIVLAIAVHPMILFCFILNLFTFMILINDYSDTIPDRYHMGKPYEYFIDDQGYTKYVHVKLFPGIWVKTAHQGPVAEFLEKKIDYQHKTKETFVI